jgi:hypothetical protein
MQYSDGQLAVQTKWAMDSIKRCAELTIEYCEGKLQISEYFCTLLPQSLSCGNGSLVLLVKVDNAVPTPSPV